MEERHGLAHAQSASDLQGTFGLLAVVIQVLQLAEGVARSDGRIARELVKLRGDVSCSLAVIG